MKAIRRSSVIFTLFYFLLLGFIMSSCDKDDFPNVPEKSKRTVLMYLVGKNSLSDDLMYDFNEIKQGYLLYPNAEEINLLIYISNKSKYDTPTLLKLHKEEFNNSILEEEVNIYPEVNSTDPEVMRKIFLKAFTSYPAQSYGLIMGSHADGWLPYPEIKMRSFGVDNGKAINIVDLASVLNDVTKGIGKKLDYILFDACFMQSIEVAYELRNSVNYLIGSPTEVPGPGGPYDVMVPSLFNTSTDFYKEIVDVFYDYYEEKYNGTVPVNDKDPEKWTGGIALSSISVQYIEKYTQLTNLLLTQSLKERESLNLKDIPHYDLRAWGHYSGYKFYHDLYRLLKSITKEENQDLFNQWEVVHNKMVYYRHTPKVYSAYDRWNLFSIEGTHGVSCYVPRQGYENMTNHYRTHQWYEAGGWKDLDW